MVALPTAFIEKYQKLLGSEADDFIASFQHPITKAFRINPLKTSQTLYDTKNDGKTAWGTWGRFGSVSGHSVDHTTGLIYSQEPSAQLVGEIARPLPGERVLDLAAAPGGKTTHLASFMQQQGLLVSNEIFRKRANILSENVERFGIRNAIVTNHSPSELAHHFPKYFDRIVLDAPCSGEGMFRKDPDAMQYWDINYPDRCAKLQREILIEAMKMLRPGGELIYSTCTFAPEEDEQVIAWLLSNYPNLSMVAIERPQGVDAGRPEWADGNPELAKAVRLFPHHLSGEGHFIAKLKLAEIEDETDNVLLSEAESNLSQPQQTLWQQFRDDIGLTTIFGPLMAWGDQLYALPDHTPDLKGIKVLRAGVHLGTFKKNRFEPALALALAVSPDDFARQYPMRDDEWAKYVHGETFFVTDQTNGWYLLTINSNGAGFGKLTNGQMKNFYPKGLRFQVK
ncbi:RsmF rRNA methyltransferase first C-terminal domain-containing protein [Weissella diestrammenae]|uniref:RsmF rRNA methyltransferase first C-terminal domain-containing protein n=1 Tax=Weissella diestrammenae TaxID=1162633 RepID=A0A7G9T669_9LACO|nr:RsmF rRNA methyltransferase first C-terminal domain-containing protein [Weissella diestrammenae]MCM0583365.1 RsmF rRNA methyltransferase first C-terminal domain-containing protein [Weissella diestrammenae]QNN75594.1 RsmF rRNA methyltransferase first C-terminal domain-containing protein [Weissella diestrammenae]